ncbi:MAG: hypothetical protein ACI8UO_006636 [Verrucomicrobiales bacterium]|jgi:hypothetical protein
MPRLRLVFALPLALSLFCQVRTTVVAQDLSEEDRARLMVKSEDLLGQLRPAMHQLDANAVRMTLPGPTPVGLVGDQVEVIKIANKPASVAEPFSIPGVVAETWPPERKSSVANSADLKLWQPFFSKVQTFAEPPLSPSSARP